MDAKSKRPKRREELLCLLTVAIEGLSVAEKLVSITPAKVVFSTVGVTLTMIRDSMINEGDYVELGLACNTVCTTIDRGLKGKQLDELSGSMLDAISQLTTTVADIQSKVIKRSKKSAMSRAFSAKKDNQAIASWRLDLNRILLTFNTELGLNIYVTACDVRDRVTKTHTVVLDTRTAISDVQRDVAGTHTVVADTHAMVSDIRRQVLERQEGAGNQRRPNKTSIHGEVPPPAPRACFGRDKLIEKIVSLAEQFTPIALIGAGGVGKTSIALTVLHHDRIKRRFGDARRFIRCDQSPISCAHFLSRLSKAIGAGIENPEDLASLRPFLSSRKMFIVLDNAESVLDPEGTDAERTYAVVEELNQLDNICLCITSRISTIPSGCETLDVPMLSIGAARAVFHHIYRNVGRSDLVDDILDQLDFHPLSITLLATVAHQNRWDTDRLRREWERQRTDVLQAMHNKSFAATIELSLASPMFQELGPDARALLGVIAFFPQGVDENNLSWLFPAISDRVNIFDKFCVLSLTHRSNSFITMLAPLRGHLCPKDPKSSPLLCMIKDRYFSRMSVKIDPNNPRYGDGRWIASEDVNVEHLLDVFTTIDANSDDVWDACANFMTHLVWHKKRLTILSSKIEGLPDGHRSKPKCLFELSRLYHSVGDNAERRRLLAQTLKLWRERGDDLAVARTLRHLSKINRQMGLPKEGIRQVQEASQILERLRDTVGQAQCLIDLASLLYSDSQLNAAEEAASRAIGLLPERGQEFRVCEHRRLLGLICQSKGETEKAVHHFEVARTIASPFNWHDQLFLVHCSLAQLFLKEGKLSDAQAHVERAKSYASNRTHYLGRAMEVQAELWYKQRRLEDAKSEVLGAIDVFGKLGAVQNLEACRRLLRAIEDKQLILGQMAWGPTGGLMV